MQGATGLISGMFGLILKIFRTSFISSRYSGNSALVRDVTPRRNRPISVVVFYVTVQGLRTKQHSATTLS